MNLHPIAQILSMCLTEKETIASKASINQIKGNFSFESEEINMISMQLNNNLQLSKIMPKNRFNIEFDANFLLQVINSQKINQYILYILLSGISWLINVENTLNASNFNLILDLFDSLPNEVGTNTVLSMYKLTNYFFECILSLNIEFSFNEIENQTTNFLNRYRDEYKTDLINDSLLKWLTIGYSFEKKTGLTQSILSLTSSYVQKNADLFTESIFNEIYKLIKDQLSIFNSFELCFLIEIARCLPSKSLVEYLSFLIESLLPYFVSKNEIQYKIFDQNQYNQSVTYDLPLVTSYSLQFSSFKNAYKDEIYIFPSFEINPNFSLSAQICKIIKYLFQILENGNIDLNLFNPLFANILQTCLVENQNFFFDIVAAILSFVNHFNKFDSYPIFLILIDSPLFNEQLTIFTENSESESVHKLRMISYYLLVFTNELSIQLFFTKKMKFPFMISELFYYAINAKKYIFTIPKTILKSETFLNQVSNSLLSYINKEGANKYSRERISSNSSGNSEILNSASTETNSNDNIYKENSGEINLTNKTNEADASVIDSNKVIKSSNDANLANTETSSNETNAIEINSNDFNLTNTETSSNETNASEINSNDFNLANTETSSNETNASEINSNDTNLTNTETSSNETNTSVFNSSGNVNEIKSDEKDLVIDKNYEQVSNIPLKESEYPNKADNALLDTDLSFSESQQNLNQSNEIYDSEYASEKSYEINDSIESLPSNSIEKINFDISESSNANSSRYAQSFQFIIQKIHHRNPIDDSNNNFLKWFNAIKYNSKKAGNYSNEQLSLSHILECSIVYILIFISKTVEEDEEIASLWNESAELVPTLFQLLFNEYIRPIILNILFKIWSSKEYSVSSQSCILTIFKQIYDEDFSLLDLQLLQTINQYLYYKMDMIIKKNNSYDESIVFMNDINLLSIIKPFNEMYPTVISILANCDITSDFLHHSMIFLGFYTKTINKTVRAAISSALLRVEGKEPNIRFYHDFILIITSFNNKDESSKFLISQPKMISVFIESFSESIYLKDVFNFIESLCEHSVSNTLSCHTGNVDITIIKYILKHKESKLIPNALRLFSKIGLCASSIPVVSHFISLFCPIKSNFSPPYISDCIQTLSSIICTKNFQPTAYLPISKKSPYVEILKLSGSKINQGFTFVAKLFIDKFALKYKSKLLSISDKNHNMTVFIVKDQITINNPQGECFTFENQLPINNWISVAISFLPSHNIAQCHIHNHTISTIKYKFIPFSNYGSLACEVGNENTSDIHIAHSTLIGRFSFYPLVLDSNFINNFEGIKSNMKFNNSNAFYKFQNQDLMSWISIQFDIDQSLLHMVISSRQSELDASLVGNNLITCLSFPDVLVKFFKTEILLPLFAQIGLPIYSSDCEIQQKPQIVPTTEMSVSFAKSILNLLSSTLQLDVEVQENFVQSQGFRIISFLLINILDVSILTFDFYMHFVLLFEDLSVEKLKIQLFYYILINSDIWSLSSQSVIQQIIVFWNKGLLLENQELFLYISPLYKLIQTVSLFYQKMENVDSDENKSIRESIIHLLYDISKLKLTEYDFNGLFMTCIAPPNLTLTKDLLLSIRMIANTDNSPLLQFSPSKRHILMMALDALLAFNDEDIVLSTIETIFTFHNKEIIQNINVFLHVEIIKMNIKKSLANESFIKKSIKLSNDSFPEMLQIPFYLILSSLSSSWSKSESAFLTNQQHLLSVVVKALQPNSKYAINKLWFLWPLVFAIKNKEIMNFMLDFIILSSMKDWLNIFVVIYIVSNCLNIDPLPIQRNFLMILASHIIEGKVTANVNQFLELTIYFILTKPIERKSSALMHLYKESVFYLEQKQSITDSEYSAPVSVESMTMVHTDSNSNLNENQKVSIGNVIEEEKNNETVSPNDTVIINDDTNISSKNELLNEVSNQSSQSNINETQNTFFDSITFFNRIAIYAKTAFSSSKFKCMLDADENGKWLDLELSEYFINVLNKCKNFINEDLYQNFVKYLNNRNTKEFNSSDILYEIYEMRLPLNNYIASRIQHISVFITKNREDAIRLDKNIKEMIDKICNDSYLYLAKVNRRKHINRKTSHKLWSDLWRTLTNDRSPWRNSLPLSETHFKRDNRVLAHFCPMKLKQNLNFTNHKDASFNREYGSSEMAKEKLFNYLKELKEKAKKEAPPFLLSVSHNQAKGNVNSNYIDNDNVDLLDDQNCDFDILNIDQEAYYYFGHFYNEFHSSSMQYHQQQNYNFNQKIVSDQKKIFDAKLLTLYGPKKIIFCVFPSYFLILYKTNDKSQIKPDKIKRIEASSVTHILFRSYLQQEKGFEIVTKNGKSYLINLKYKRSLELLQKISEYQEFKNAFIQTLPPIEFIKSLNIQSKWSQGLISNFEYLMMLNFFGGRTFNETAMYPVFPWLIKDYSSSKIDLKDPAIFRDLSSPIGALNESRLNDLKKHLQDYVSFRDKGFLYNSCFISPLCVYLWLIRVEPFTSLHIELQSGRFDYSTRIFTSIPAAYKMVTNHMNDYRELIPEFFYTSSFLENRNHFDLGVLHGHPVDDVVLPKWCKSAIEFIYIHRKALECDYVNEHLNEWIDLVFGDSQKEPKAKEKNNTFDPCLYEDIWSYQDPNDETQRKMIKAVLKHCGHIPNQLFTHPHPSKQRFVVKPISHSISFSPSEAFPRSIFVKLFTRKSSTPGSSCVKSCIFVSESGLISIAFLKTDFQSRQTFYQIISHPSIGELSPSSMPTKKRKLEKMSSSPLITGGSNIVSDSEYANRIDPEKLQMNLSLANTSEKSVIFAFNPSNLLLVVATNIGAVIVTQLLSDTKRDVMLTKHVGKVNCVAVSDNFIVSGGSDTSINIWSSNRDIQLKKVQVESSKIPLSSTSSSTFTSKPKSFLNINLAETNSNSDKKFSSNSNFSKSWKKNSLQSYKVIDEAYNSPIRHLKTIQSFRNEITCIDISEKFGTIASGTKDGSVILIDTSSLESIVTIDISPEIPVMVKITSCWGFVVVYSNKEHEGRIKSYLSVFDIDGQFIRKKQISFEISCWCQFTSLDGFDYMFVGSIKSDASFQSVKSHTGESITSHRSSGFNLYLFEVFYLDIDDAGVERSESRFVEVKYCVRKGILYAVTENGSVFVYSSKELNTGRFDRTVFGADS